MCCQRGPAPPPTSGDAVAAFRLRDPDLTPSTSKEGEVRITPTALRTNMQEGRSIQKHTWEPAVLMAVEGASKTATHDCGRCTGRRAPRGLRAYRAVPAGHGRLHAVAAGIPHLRVETRAVPGSQGACWTGATSGTSPARSGRHNPGKL